MSKMDFASLYKAYIASKRRVYSLRAILFVLLLVSILLITSQTLVILKLNRELTNTEMSSGAYLKEISPSELQDVEELAVTDLPPLPQHLQERK